MAATVGPFGPSQKCFWNIFSGIFFQEFIFRNFFCQEIFLGNFFWEIFMGNFLWEIFVGNFFPKFLTIDSWQVAVGRWQVAGGSQEVADGRWHVAQLSGGCEKGWY